MDGRNLAGARFVKRGMADKRSKYDTDPLDPDFVRGTEEVRSGGATREVARTPNEEARRAEGAEAPTLKLAEPFEAASYPSVFVPPQAPPVPLAPQSPAGATHVPPPAAALPPGSTRTVAGIGMPANVAAMVPYIPFYIGGILAAIELFLVPRHETRVRFHAAQALALHAFIFVVGIILRFAGTLADNMPLGGVAAVILGLGGLFFSIAAIIFLVISMVRVWKGEEHRIKPLADATRWLDEQIEPRKQ